MSSVRFDENKVHRKLKREDLRVGMVLFREVNGRTKVREVLELWDGQQVRAELRAWGIYLGWQGTSDWNRVRYLQRGGPRSKDKEDRCTRMGLARWAHGVLETNDA